jgi:hypothetical protein
VKASWASGWLSAKIRSVGSEDQSLREVCCHVLDARGKSSRRPWPWALMEQSIQRNRVVEALVGVLEGIRYSKQVPRW